MTKSLKQLIREAVSIIDEDVMVNYGDYTTDEDEKPLVPLMEIGKELALYLLINDDTEEVQYFLVPSKLVNKVKNKADLEKNNTITAKYKLKEVEKSKVEQETMKYAKYFVNRVYNSWVDKIKKDIDDIKQDPKYLNLQKRLEKVTADSSDAEAQLNVMINPAGKELSPEEKAETRAKMKSKGKAGKLPPRTAKTEIEVDTQDLV